jgi:ribonuclease T2
MFGPADATETPTVRVTPPPGAIRSPDAPSPARQPTTAAAARPTATPRSASPAKNTPGVFDFYVLALSWSPDYCAASGTNDPQQCSVGRRLGFVLHGLWPQYNQGSPSDCSTAKLPAAVKAQFAGLYPSASLYDHEWEKHGTCSGQTPEQYLALSKQFKDSVAIPDRYRAPEQPIRTTVYQLKQDIVAANPGLNQGSLAVMCSGSGRYLQELQVCFQTNGEPATCSSEIQKDANNSCRQADILVRNVR